MKDFKFGDEALAAGAEALAVLKKEDRGDEYDPMVRYLSSMDALTDIAAGKYPKVKHPSAAAVAIYIHKNNGQAGLAANIRALFHSDEPLERDLALACSLLLAAKFAEARL